MLSTPTPDPRSENSSLHSSSLETGWQRQGKLWSNLKELCEVLRILPTVVQTDEELLFQHVQFKTGQRVHTIGQPFDTLYIVHSGFLKTVLIDEFGNEQVLSFPMKGDLFGVDGIHTKRYASEAVALSNCDLILLPFKKLTALGRAHVEFEHAMYSVMSRELVREQSMVSMLGALSAEARVARFLVNLAERYADMGYSSKLFNLRMTRHEIGSYLGLTLETVSRTLSAFNEIGLITVDQRSIGIKDPDALRTLRRLPPSSTRAKQLASKKARQAAAGQVNGKDAPDGEWGKVANAYFRIDRKCFKKGPLSRAFFISRGAVTIWTCPLFDGRLHPRSFCASSEPPSLSHFLLCARWCVQGCWPYQPFVLWWNAPCSCFLQQGQ
jgi:CRP/FNR family transcriptional regulator, anaerobic regulatory protein